MTIAATVTDNLPACAFWDIPEGNIDMHDWQAGCCAFCGELCWPHTRLVRDHDHDSGFIRGYLCDRCNTTEPYMTTPAWEQYRNGVNPANILAQHELYYGTGHIIEQAMWRQRRRDPAWARHVEWSTL